MPSLLFFTPQTVQGVAFRIPNQDAEAIGRGNAFAATADNPAALYYNPGGITQLRGFQVQAGLYSTVVTSHYESPNGRKDSTQFEIQAVPQMYYVWHPEEKPYAFGLGIYVPYGLGLQWNDSVPFRDVGLEGRLQYTTIQPTLAWEFGKGLSIAIGPTLNHAQTTLRRGIAAPGDQFEFKGHDIAFGFKAGVLWQICDQWSLGASYHSETTMDLHGHSIARPYANAESTTAEVPFPQFVIAGVSYRPTPNWNLEFNIDWTDWDRVNTLTFERPSGNIPVGFNWNSSFFYEFGVTRKLNHGFFASVGYFFSENSTSDRDFTPVVPDTDLHIGSVGFGRKKEKWSYALAYQIISGPPREINNGTSAQGKFNFFNHALVASIGYKF